MTVIEDLMVTTEIPLKKVTSLRFKWCLNEHAFLHLEGMLDASERDEFLRKKNNDTKILIIFKNNTLFHGIIKETRIQAAGGVFVLLVQAVSATYLLDQKRHNEMFQDSSMTYKKMMQQIIKNASGSIICTTGDVTIEKPLLCFEETVWQYAIRMASHMHSNVIPDVITGKPDFWFGLRKGNQVKDDSADCKEIVVRKSLVKKGKEQIFYCLTSREHHLLGDQLLWDNNWHIIYKMEAFLERGELLFHYWITQVEALRTDLFYQKKITGLSLIGTVTKVRKEQVYVKLDIDGKTGTYPFLWYPETGTGLYAMPEPGARVELYFMGSDERKVTAIRCRNTKSTDADVKKMEIPDETRISMSASGLRLEKNDSMSLSDSRIDISGKREVQISASGKVKIKAKIIEVNSMGDITYVTEL